MYLGDFAEDATVYLMFNTFTSDDPSASSTITDFINTDVHIHKDDGLTQRNNAAGITVSVNFDGITGSHMIKIDTSDDTVGGFWVTGSDYFVRIEGTTIDGATINAVVGQFSIENRYNPVTDYDGPTKAEMDAAHDLLATEAKQDIIDTNIDQIETAVITNAAGADIAADIIALKAETALIVADTGTDGVVLAADAITSAKIADNAISAEHLNTGALTADAFAADAIVAATLATGALTADAFAADALVAATFATNSIAADALAADAVAEIADGVWDEVINVGHAVANSAAVDLVAILADTDELQTDDYPTSIAAVKAETALIVADTNELQTDDYPTSIAAIKAETALIVADTNELQTDWANDGRLDVILDAASAPTAADVADAVWDEDQVDHVGAGTFGVVASEVASILDDTDLIDDATDGLAAIKAEVEGLAGEAMRGTDNGALAAVCTEGRLAELDAANIPNDIAAVPTAAENADKILGRSIAAGADGGRTIQDALRAIRNRRAVAADVLTVYEEDDLTPAWTADVTTSAGNPVSEIDPT